MNPLKKTIKTISSVLTIILLIILVLVIYGRLTVMFSKNSYPNYFGYSLFEVSSGSMEPALSVNDVILVKLNYKDYKKGDIITYINEKGEIITHRIVLVNADTLTVKGDANNTIDNPINKKQVIGKVERVYSQLSVWQKVITEPKILIVLFITLLAFDFALSYDGDKDEEKKKTVKAKEEKQGEPKEKKDNKKSTSEETEPLKSEDVIKRDIPKPKKKATVSTMKVNDSIDIEALLDFTRRIDLEAINRALDDKTVKLNKSEMNDLKKKIDSIDEDKPVLPELGQKEKEFIEYTIRLDLKAIQKNFKHKGK